MKSLVFIVAAAIVPSLIFAQQQMSAPAKPTVKSNATQSAKVNARSNIIRQTGGRIVKPNSAKGKIVILNAQTKMSDDDINTAIAILKKDVLFNFVVVKKNGMSEFGKTGIDALSAAKSALGANILVAIIDDQASPIMLAAPEDGWAAMNVAKLVRGLVSEDAKAKFFASRCRKELMRTFAYACGVAGSSFVGNTLTLAKVEDIDYCGEYLPFDAIQQIMKLNKVRGITPSVRATYLYACREGWAPAPTNDIQKAIWDKVHQLPTKPIKILPETKPVKE